MIKAVIFDMDGLMVDSETLGIRELKQIMKEDFRINLSTEEIIPSIGKKPKFSFETLLKKHKLKGDLNKLVEKKRKIHSKLIQKELEVMPGTIELIEKLGKEKFLLAIASSSRQEEINLILKKFSLKKKFDAIISGDEIKELKPNPEIFLKTAAALNVPPKNCVVLEDSVHGIGSAKNAGMKAIAVPNEFTKGMDFSKADRIVKSLKEVSIELIKTM